MSHKNSNQQQSIPLKIPIPKHSPKLQPLIIPSSKNSSQLVHKLKTENIPQISFPVCSSIQQAVDICYRQYNKLFVINQQINNRLIEVIFQRNQLADKFNHLKKSKCSDEYVKRKRRQAKDIEREFFCPIEKCKKGYGSEGSLTHHVRLKHKDYYQSGNYQIFIQQYIEKIINLQKQKQQKNYMVKQEYLEK